MLRDEPLNGISRRLKGFKDMVGRKVFNLFNFINTVPTLDLKRWHQQGESDPLLPQLTYL
jgi:hypothetical protein